MHIFCSGGVSDVLFGLKSGSKNKDTGYVDITKAHGLFLKNQLNHFMEAVSAFKFALREDSKWEIGRIITGTSANSRPSLVLEKRSFF